MIAPSNCIVWKGLKHGKIFQYVPLFMAGHAGGDKKNCYACDSQLDEGCGDPFTNRGQVTCPNGVCQVQGQT